VGKDDMKGIDEIPLHLLKIKRISIIIDNRKDAN